VRVQLKMSSTGLAYFPGLAKPFTIDSNTLSANEAARLEQLVAEARFSDQPAEVSATPKGGADYRQYTVTIDSGHWSHTVRLTDPVGEPDLQALLDYLKSKGGTLGAGSST
jgi:Emfourin